MFSFCFIIILYIFLGSGERTNSEDHNASIDATAAGGLTLSQMSQMSFGGSATNSALGGLAAHSLHTTKLLKEGPNNDLEANPQDSDSLDDTHGHVHMQIVINKKKKKTKTIIAKLLIYVFIFCIRLLY